MKIEFELDKEDAKKLKEMVTYTINMCYRTLSQPYKTIYRRKHKIITASFKRSEKCSQKESPRGL